jgi:hypothetical protein
MTTLLDKLEERKIIPILMTPTMFDLRPALGGDNFFGAWVFQMANERGFGYVNMYEPLNRITRENRKEDPDFTLIEDAVHPGPNGQLVMALSFLRDIGANPVVSTIHLDVDKLAWKTIQADNGKLERLDGGLIRFRFISGSLPWVVPEEASPGFKISNAASLMSQEIVRVTGLEPGNYTLWIDGEMIGQYTHLQFSAGLALQKNNKTPQYQQASKIAELNKQRNDEAVRPLRDLWLVRKIAGWIINKPEEVDEEEKKKFKEEFGLEDPHKFFATFAEENSILLKKAMDLEKQIYKFNKPVPHIYEIRKGQ